MDVISDIFLAAGALGAAFYCFVLGRRLKRFNDLEKGVGGAVAVLSIQVDDLTKTLEAARGTASVSAQTLTELTERAEAISRNLELQMASLHDIPAFPPKDMPNAASALTPEPETQAVSESQLEPELKFKSQIESASQPGSKLQEKLDSELELKSKDEPNSEFKLTNQKTEFTTGSELETEEIPKEKTETPSDFSRTDPISEPIFIRYSESAA